MKVEFDKAHEENTVSRSYFGMFLLVTISENLKFLAMDDLRKLYFIKCLTC